MLSISWSYLERVLPAIGLGFWITVQVAAGALLVAGIVALALTALQQALGRPAVAVTSAFVNFLRYTPVLVQLYLFYFGLPLIGIDLSAFWCGALAIGLQQGCYASEILRSGLGSVDSRQVDAGLGLGLTRMQTLGHVMLPQAFIKSMPSLANQGILLLKDTTIVSAIGIMETTLTVKALSEQSGNAVPLFAIAALTFLTATMVLGFGVRILESRLQRRFGG
ncbi:amino acid ABC transporter permease [Comamonadaceae bacterium G21597-S1]|nr:amino acid ABC transporter permease [Comamonadaceae bacterium G21597-S1]